MKKLTSCSSLIIPALGAMVMQYGQETGKDFSKYLHPSFSSMAIGHIEGTSINGIVTIDIDQVEKSADIKISSLSSLTDDQEASLLTFALLKSINFGCKTAKVKGSSGIEKYFEGSEFGSIRSSDSGKNTIEFFDLPSADLRTMGLYSIAGYTSGAIAVGSILTHSFFDSLSYMMGGGYAKPALAFASSGSKQAA